MFARVRSFIDGVLRRERVEAQMSDEMRFHMREYADDLVESGVTRGEAERRARIEFGSVESAREEARQARGLRVVDETRQDLRYALRQLAKTPAFTIAAIVSLALGIGANTAIFSLMDAVLFRWLPVAEPQALYFLGHRGSGPKPSSSANYPLLARYQASDVFAGVTAYEWETFAVRTAEGLERVEGQFVSGNYHAVVRVPFTIGRGFSDEPDRPSGRGPIAVISDGYWERRFGRSPDVIGRILTIGGRATTIVGVTAPGFHGLVAGARLDITLPMYVKALAEPEFFDARDGWTSLSLVARLGDGVTETRAAATVAPLFQAYWMEPDNAWARRDTTTRRGELIPAGKGTSRLRTEYQKPLRVLLAMVVVVLLVSSTNVANLLLARATARTREVALRMSIGAGRWRLVRQFLTESLLLSAIGGILGLVVAAAGTRLILSFFQTGRSPVLLDAPLNGRVLAVTAGISVLTGLVFGLAPALRATRIDLAPALLAGDARGMRRPRLGAGRSLVVAQFAMCVMLVAGAALLVRTLHNLRSIDGGFARENVVMFNVETDDPGFTDERRIQFYSAMLQRVQALPGVLTASYSKRSPIDFSSERRAMTVPGRAEQKDGEGVSSNIVSPEFFLAFGIRVMHGRGFTGADRAGAPMVAVVGESMAKTYFGGGDPLGRTILMGGKRTPMTIVGVVSDVRFERLRESPPAMVYTPLAQPSESFEGQMSYPRRLTVVIRANAGPGTLAAAARGLVNELSPNATLTYVRTMEQQLNAALVRERVLAHLSSAFGILALVLAFVGLYGVMSYGVVQRTREIGIRIALGASRGMVLRKVLRETLLISAAGIAIGLVATLAATKLVSAFLFGLSSRDPITLVAVTGMLFATAMIAGYLPARRAAGLQPTQALKTD